MLAVRDRLWTTFNARDWDAYFELATDDVVMRTDPAWPGGGTYRGREEIMHFAEQFLEPWEELRYEQVGDHDVIDERRLVERGSWVGSGLASGIAGTVEFTVVISFRGPLIERADFFLSEPEALEFARGASA
jgi:hypothetical protein